MQNLKKPPMRRCIACGQSKPKRELVRIVHQPDGTFALDRTGRLNGRGAYVCDNKECFSRAISRKLLNKAFQAPIPPEAEKQLLEAMEYSE